MWKILVILLCLTALILLVVMICDSNRFVKVSYRISDRRLKKNCRSSIVYPSMALIGVLNS